MSQHPENQDWPQNIIQDLFDLASEIRYVAVYAQNNLTLRQGNAELKNTSDAESDRYEELLVNPTLLTLASQRGNIDCGGLNYILVAYGNFFQLVKKIPGGHISVCLDKAADLSSLPDRICTLISKCQE